MTNNLKQSQRGFTLIELVMVIVVLGVLAAVAIPKFVSLKDEAVAASLEGVAGSLSSAAAINYGVRTANVLKGVAITTCDVSAALLGGLPAGYTVTATAVPAGTSATCVVTHTASTKTANYTAIGIL